MICDREMSSHHEVSLKRERLADNRCKAETISEKQLSSVLWNPHMVLGNKHLDLRKWYRLETTTRGVPR